ncbi:transcription termination factor Rho [candidate division WWE3 bacterium CG08_land_8_20_14_0_20_40_13]|uniref:Transcription termination factor Rho n=1 Tax=candidate division WWE3 bacterium CG08_land_8_20_14_0_20_40_13 TaxID=1975084 RepID=A0A2H0XEA3_UNCKA|nr:MAG: transcription termination factor Rho [candidate division WWE3 bacterium CG08_land_8_20_14_0_20_40_13]
MSQEVSTIQSGGEGFGGQNSRYSNYQRRDYPREYGSSSDDFSGETIKVAGVLEVLQDYGILRQERQDATDDPSRASLPKDVYVSQSQIKRFNLRMGDSLEGLARPPKEGERYLSLLKVEKVEGTDPEKAKERPSFGKLTPIYPNKKLNLETKADIITTRLIDIVAPIGKGTRGMIVSPPKAGKTWVLKDIAHGIEENYPDIVLKVVLIGERPEEVTDMKRSVKGEVFASNFDEDAEIQTRVAELVLERSKRLAEKGRDVVILMDSVTRLARAYNLVVPPSGRTLSGGIDPTSLYPPKHFFGAARNFEEGGSLTILATALVDTGSKMDDVIYEEFKGTGNMELHLDRTLANRGIYPAIDITDSGTRNWELLFDKKEMESVYKIRRMVDLLDPKEATELVIARLKKTKTNKEFMETLHENK